MTSYAITATGIEHYADALGQFEHLLGRLTGKEAQRATRGELEALVQTEGSELLRRLIQGHLDQRGSQEPIRERVVGADGRARTQRRGLQAVFGDALRGGDRHPPGHGASGP